MVPEVGSKKTADDRADDAGDADRCAHAKMRIGLYERGGRGTHAAVVQIEIRLLVGGVMLGDSEVGVRADVQDRTVVQGDARAGEMPGIDHIAPENFLGSRSRSLPRPAN